MGFLLTWGFVMSNLIQNSNLFQDHVFSDADYAMWKKIFIKQIVNLQDKAHPIFLSNYKRLKLSANEIPKLGDLNAILLATTGWQVVPVDGLIGNEQYFHLLSKRIFPVAMIMRTSNEELLSKDPDIFHEIFGHCTMLMSSDYADFMQEFAKFALTVKTIDRPIIARLLWFTTETGLIKTESGLKIFGGSLLSSYAESIYCLTSKVPILTPFNLIDIFREPYRADILQKKYFILNDMRQLYCLLNKVNVLLRAVGAARALGENPPLFPVTFDKYSNVGHCYSLKKTVPVILQCGHSS